ncbi:unnamed protein product [Paramecium pentaurelia]|uniref:Uncharacterized protein n=1 Tax=Paramecium pentaurelia TaxID=43138 RepID=A0A8S1TF46_9CILI|nr:unnamed protein product [Paramecium pentaurelia]
MNKEQLKICLENIDEYVRGQKRLERKNKILAQSNKLKTIQNQRNQTKIQEENIPTKVKKQVKKSEKENKKKIQSENQHQVPKVIKQKSKIQNFLEEIHVKILPFNNICEQIEKFYQFKNKVIEESAFNSNQPCIYQPICKKKSVKEIKARTSISPISTKQTVSIRNKQNKRTPLDFFSFNSKFKKLVLFKEDISETCEIVNGIRILYLNKQ